MAQTLLSQPAANFLVICDEFDKVQVGGWNSDPYRPFYTLLEPAGARRFVDEYLQFPMDASGVMWAMAANDLAAVPEPILDRLTVICVPDLMLGQRNTVVLSIYADLNASRGSWFGPVLAQDLVVQLALMTPRRARVALDEAMITAASEGRSKVLPSDLRALNDTGRIRIGF